MDVEAVFEEAELFEALGELESAVRQVGEDVKGGFAVCVQTDVLPVLRREGDAGVCVL